jgi:glycosyltransferase involved in cell wall biosynthesis
VGMRIHYFPLERYQERYTEMLDTWVLNVLTPKHEVRRYGHAVMQRIECGRVLDGTKRVSYCAEQVQQFMDALRQGQVRDMDVLWFDDMFTPGIEGIFYALHMHGIRPRIWTRCWAQTPDIYDFTFSMQAWMRHYEHMVCEQVEHVFVACQEHKDLCVVAGWPADKIVVTGLPFSTDDVHERYLEAWPKAELLEELNADRAPSLIYSSRWDREKNPSLFLDLAADIDRRHGAVAVRVCTGHESLTGTDHRAIARAYEMAESGALQIHTNLSKGDYYAYLMMATTQVNTALQDWVSFTMLEAMSFNVASVVPAFRGFLSCTDPIQRYLPGCRSSLYDAVERSWDKREAWLSKQLAVLGVHNLTLDRQEHML